MTEDEMSEKSRSPIRQQCAKCPWKKSTDPHDIPNGYCEKKHANLKCTIAVPGELRFSGSIRLMACHETERSPCVGWLAHQLGPGNNIALRLAVMSKQIDGNVETVGEQHETFEDTLL